MISACGSLAAMYWLTSPLMTSALAPHLPHTFPTPSIILQA